ncbi:fumarylacetoacetate hydrolase family protein [Ramlibacter sp.]|uniref:fumarylacetoacetate hydrolase family protein n=1 Tax=Ramlibacter sp. TaxID=1917967 RepID=UPI003D1279F4
MKLATFTESGRGSWGIVEGDSVADVGAVLAHRYAGIRQLLAGNGLAEASKALASARRIAMSQVKLDLPVPDAARIICIGRNYRAHVAEGSAPPPEHPEFFLRTSDSLVPHGDVVQRPKVSTSFDYEGELAVVIGRGGRHIAKADALSHVAGYTILEDGSVRDFQRQHSLAAGKNFHRSGAMGPWICTADEIPDPSRLTLTTRLNGNQVQHSGLDALIFDIPTLIAYLSDIFLLAPGDVIATGTPAGVGFARKPPLWVKAGDRIEVEIQPIGTLAVGVEDA